MVFYYNIMIQQEYFRNITYGKLLNLKKSTYCNYPKNEDDVPDLNGLWLIDKLQLLTEISKRGTQKEYFSKASVHLLLAMRYRIYCNYPVKEGDKVDLSSDSGDLWDIDKNMLYAELNRRRHVTTKRERKKPFVHPKLR